MTDAPKASRLLAEVQQRLRIVSLTQAVYVASLAILGGALLMVLASRLLGLIQLTQEHTIWLLTLPAAAAVLAGIFHRRVARRHAARAIDEHARTKDLFLTLSSLSSSAGEYQPLVTSSAEQQAEKIQPAEVVPYRVGERPILSFSGLAVVFILAVLFTPQLDPLGHVEAATRVENQRKEIEAIKQSALSRADRLKKEQERADEDSQEIESRLNQLKSDFRKMEPKKVTANARVLDRHGQNVGDMWKAAQSEQLRRMMNEPISNQQLGNRSQKMNQWLEELQQGKTEGLKEQMKKTQELMAAMASAKDPEERKKLESQLQDELQTLHKFAKEKAGSKELSNALNKALKAMRVAKSPGENAEQTELSQEAMEALKESLKVTEMEMEKMAQSAEDLQKLEAALETLQKAQELNSEQQLDGSKCEGCESMEDYAEMYAQMMGQSGEGEGDKDRNEGGDGGVGRGGETPEDDSDPEGYKTEKEKPQIMAGKILLSIKTKEHADQLDFDPDKMRKYQQSVDSIKQNVQSVIDAEEIPPGYVDGIKGYFDKIEAVDQELKQPESGE